jgi:hypothetical protein
MIQLQTCIARSFKPISSAPIYLTIVENGCGQSRVVSDCYCQNYSAIKRRCLKNRAITHMHAHEHVSRKYSPFSASCKDQDFPSLRFHSAYAVSPTLRMQVAGLEIHKAVRQLIHSFNPSIIHWFMLYLLESTLDRNYIVSADTIFIIRALV